MEETTKKDEDIPKTLVVILVVLAVFISILGTFTVLSEMARLNTAPEFRGTPVQSGEISLTVEDPNAVRHSSITGQVVLSIEKRPGE